MRTRKWKRALALALVSVTAFTMAGCGNGGGSNGSSGSGDGGAADGGGSGKDATELTLWLTNEGENYEKVFQKFSETGGKEPRSGYQAELDDQAYGGDAA